MSNSLIRLACRSSGGGGDCVGGADGWRGAASSIFLPGLIEGGGGVGDTDGADLEGGDRTDEAGSSGWAGLPKKRAKRLEVVVSLEELASGSTRFLGKR